MPLPTDNIRSFHYMCGLVWNAHFPQLSRWSMEMVLAIMWEETFFQNIRQFRAEGVFAVGFGQVQHPDGISTTNAGLGYGLQPNMPYNTTAILGSDFLAVKATSDCLNAIYTLNKMSNPRDALYTYSGNRSAVVAQWENCEKSLIAILAGGADYNPMTWNTLKIEDALREARTFPKSGPQYESMHNQLFLIQDWIGWVATGTFQFGAEGKGVWGLQEGLNRTAFQQPSNLPPLAVDGIFGPKTDARVKEFQSFNGLEVDGIVGPMTFGKLQQLLLL